MNNERIISMEANTMIYHKKGCGYAHRIKYKNLLSLTKSDAKYQGYRVCRYCNSMNYHFTNEQYKLDEYKKHKNMDYKFIDGIIYIKTEISCWKLVYIRKDERFALYHRNYTDKPLNFDCPQYEPYHLQMDNKNSSSIASILYYIYEHDKYKAAIARGEKITSYSNKKYMRRAERAEKKRSVRRVDYLFGMLDKQNSSYKQLSYC